MDKDEKMDTGDATAGILEVMLKKVLNAAETDVLKDSQETLQRKAISLTLKMYASSIEELAKLIWPDG